MKNKLFNWESVKKIKENLDNINGLIAAIMLLLATLSGLIGYKFGENENSLSAMKEISKSYSYIREIEHITKAKKQLCTQISNEISINQKQIKDIVKIAQDRAVENDGIRVGLAFYVQENPVCENKEYIFTTYHNVSLDFGKYEYLKAMISLINHGCITAKDTNKVNRILYQFVNTDPDNDVKKFADSTSRLIRLRSLVKL